MDLILDDKVSFSLLRAQLRELCIAHATGQISWQQYRELRRTLINSIVEIERDKTVPMGNYVGQ